eukprot:1146760-Pelagomonas_calceolata.AAC.4
MWLRPHITDRLDMELVDGFPLADAVGCGRPKPAVQFGCDGGLTSLDRLELELLEGSALAGAVGCGCEKAVQTGFTCRTDGLALQRVGTAHSYSGELGPAGLPGLPKELSSRPPSTQKQPSNGKSPDGALFQQQENNLTPVGCVSMRVRLKGGRVRSSVLKSCHPMKMLRSEVSYPLGVVTPWICSRPFSCPFAQQMKQDDLPCLCFI